MPRRKLLFAAMVFGVLALTAGGLQLWAFIESEQPRRAVLAVFASSVGLSVLAAAALALR
jgi:hypothetical protein